jgi:hypothetical protein
MRLSVLGLILTLALAMFVAPLAIEAQQPAKVPRLGLLILVSSSAVVSRIEAFRQASATSGMSRARISLLSLALQKGKLTGSPRSWRS